ncbi:MAG: DUF4350 domain-containing protein [Proteobacteria bacterium]|nr:DUF4350 domain-containing protein [Pseudomonadota bacterium]
MNWSLRETLVYTLGALLLAIGTWWWFDTFEKGWQARWHTSKEARQNPMLAATRLLTQHGYTVKVEPVLRDVLLHPLPAGTLIIPENIGTMNQQDASTLLAWVQRGNTLILRPRYGRFDEKSAPDHKKDRRTDADRDELDPIGKRYGVVLKSQYECDCEDQTAKPQQAEVSKGKPAQKEFTLIGFPDTGYALQLEKGWLRMRNELGKENPDYSLADEAGQFVRIYREGRGQVVLLTDNFFSNASLRKYDHAELLLSLAKLPTAADGKAGAFVIVQGMEMPRWYRSLWANYQAGLIGIACLLLLSFWVALRRFGPLLPDPDDERRSLLEHIDASGRWLWKVPGGREILLNATRAATNKLLQRRAPELQRLEPQEQIRLLAETVRLSSAELVLALHRPASHIPAEFTRQIHTLQRLRKFHER